MTNADSAAEGSARGREAVHKQCNPRATSNARLKDRCLLNEDPIARQPLAEKARHKRPHKAQACQPGWTLTQQTSVLQHNCCASRQSVRATDNSGQSLCAHTLQSQTYLKLSAVISTETVQTRQPPFQQLTHPSKVVSVHTQRKRTQPCMCGCASGPALHAGITRRFVCTAACITHPCQTFLATTF